MTRKDYELIARALKEARMHAIRSDAEEGGGFWLRVVASELALALASDNPRFDRDRFLKACGVAG